MQVAFPLADLTLEETCRTLLVRSSPEVLRPLTACIPEEQSGSASGDRARRAGQDISPHPGQRSPRLRTCGLAGLRPIPDRSGRPVSMELGPPASTHTDNAEAGFPCASCRTQDSHPVKHRATVPQLLRRTSRPAFPAPAPDFQTTLALVRWPPKPSATGVLRSFRTSNCLSKRPCPQRRLARRTPPPLSALRRGKLPQLLFTPPAINTTHSLSSIPKATTTLANFQLNAQFHDEFSIKQLLPPALLGQRSVAG